VELRAWVKRHVCFAYIVKSKTRSKHKRVIQSDQDVQVCGIFFEGGWTPLHDPSLFFNFHGCGLSFSFFSFWHALWACGVPSLGMHLSFLFFFIFFLTCLLSMWHTFFGYASFISFCIAHILDGHFREKESWYVMEFYFVGGWQCLLCERTCTWSWSWQYDKSLTRVKEFDQTQSKVKLHKKVWAWTSNFGFGRISLIWGDKLLMIFFWKEIPSTLQRRAWFHSSNHITLVNYLDSMGSLWGYMFTRTWKNARNKEYASLFMEAHGVHKAIGKVHWV